MSNDIAYHVRHRARNAINVLCRCVFAQVRLRVCARMMRFDIGGRFGKFAIHDSWCLLLQGLLFVALRLGDNRGANVSSTNFVLASKRDRQHI